MNEREAFEEWVKKEHPHIYSGSLKDNEGSVRFKMDMDFMFSAWKASVNRQGYKLVPVSELQKYVNSIRHYNNSGDYDRIEYDLTSIENVFTKP